MTTQNTLSINQTNMIQLAYMLNDKELGELINEQCRIVINFSKANLQTIEYINALYKRLRREAELVIEAISFEEIVDRTTKMYSTYERLNKTNESIIEEIKNDENVKEAFSKHVQKLNVYVKEREPEFKEIVQFYRTFA